MRLNTSHILLGEVWELGAATSSLLSFCLNSAELGKIQELLSSDSITSVFVQFFALFSLP